MVLYILFPLIISSKLSIYIFLDIEVIHLQILFFKVLINLSAATDFPSLCVDCTSISLSCNHNFIDLLQNLLPLSTHILLGLHMALLKTFRKALVTAITFLSFKGTTHACLLKISMTHYQNQNLL